MGTKEGTEKAGESFFRKLVANMWKSFIGEAPQTLDVIMDEFKKRTKQHDPKAWARFCDNCVERKIMDRNTADLILTIEKEPFPYDFFESIMIRMSVFTHNIESIMSIYDLERQYAHLASTHPNPAPADALIRSMMIDPKRTNENRAQLAKYGYDKTQIDNMILSYYRTTEEGTIRACYLRGIITNEVMYERMHELGYTDTRIAEIVQTWELLPGPGDLFTMVAHESFEPEIYGPLGLDSEFPDEQVEWLKKQGISEAWARKYWIAHWEQPSVGQGFEMLHRGEIDPAELDILFKTVEIPPYWRPKLTAIAYHPFTRVDVRRMHDAGVLSDEELIRSYKDLGFDDEKALKMAQFTVSYNASHEKELTRGAILDSYESGLISRADAKSLLTSQEYSDPLAEYYLTLSDYNTDQEIQKLAFENVRERFLLHDISESQVRDRLGAMNVQGEKIDALIENWSLRMYKYERLPTRSDLTDFLIRGIISEAQYRAVMTRHGYSPAHIGWYLEEIVKPPAGTPRFPSRTDLENFLKKGIIDEDEYRSEMKLHGYADKYINYYLQEM